MDVKLSSGTDAPGGCRNTGGKIVGTLFFLVFFLMGAGFAVAIVVSAFQETAVWFWPEVECTILASGVETTGDDSDPYRPSIRFGYRFDGREYESTVLTRADTTTSSYDTARRPSDRYPAGSRTACRVNPDRPEEAVLERRLPWIGLVVFFPLIFVAVGGGGIYFLWRKSPSGESATGTESISQRARGRRNLGHRIELGIGLLFTAVGGGLTILLLVVPGLRLIDARAWVETPATVISSTVRSWSTDDGTSYGADVLYEYSAGGRSWRSNRRSFFPMSSSDYDDAHTTVRRYPTGASTTCFVDPDNPTKSVLDKRFRPVYLIGLFPLLFLGAGLGLTAHSRRSRSSERSEPGSSPPQPVDQPPTRVLEADAGPLAKIAGMLFFAVFWNGIVSVFVWQAVKAWQRGSPDWFLMVFLIPFVLVGLALIGGIFYTVLAAFNPRPRVSITPAAPRLGSTLRIEWQISGRVSRIDRLHIALEGFEKATYRRGTNTYTDREVFISLDLVDTTADWEFPRGTAEVAIPEDTMHSFASANNAIAWSLHVHGEIPRWPDVMEDYDVEIRPMDRERMLP